MSESITTTDHDVIKEWVERRGGYPATVHGTHGKGEDAGLLRIGFDEAEQGDSLDPIEWENFFQKFDSEGLAFLYQDETKEGETSRFCKFVERDSDE